MYVRNDESHPGNPHLFFAFEQVDSSAAEDVAEAELKRLKVAFNAVSVHSKGSL
jgi:hypothetical protein